MGSAGGPPATLVWAFRGLALGSTAWVGAHMLRTVETSPPSHAVALAYSQEELLARTGVQRVGRVARAGGDKRRRVLEAGAVGAVAHAAARDEPALRAAALEAVPDIAAEELGALQVLGEPALVQAMAEGGDGAAEAWRAVVAFKEARRLVRKGGVCERCRGEGRRVLEEEGVC